MYNQGKIMRRLLGRPSANDTPGDNSNLGATSSPVPLSYRPNVSQNASYQSGTSIASLDRSPDGQFAVLSGRYVLKTLRVDGTNIKESVDLRGIITAQQAGKGIAPVADQLSIKDAKWAKNQGGDLTLFTACANGKIFHYNISRVGSGTHDGTGLEVIQTREDTRQINRLDVNPHKNTWLLSGSQDGIVRLFDVKAPRPGPNGQATYRAFQAYRCNADGIRDVKWSPKDGMVFACATESGAILEWDMRRANRPLLKINAHDAQRGVSSISWHPDGDHLISGGPDNKIFVWDLSKLADKKQKPKWTISAPAPVSVVTWRPALWSATAQGKRAAQIAVSYDEGGPSKKYGINSVHIWDLGRPTLPFKEINMFGSPPNALAWHGQDLLWTAGQDGLFTQCDIAFAPKVIDRQSLSSLDFSPRGDVLMLLEERGSQKRPRPTVVPQESLPPTSSYSSSPSGQMLSISRSDSEEDVVGSFLGPRKRAGRRRRPSARSAQTFSSTPPSGSGSEEPVIPLAESVGVTGAFKSQQIMAIGHIPAAPKVDVYQYLSAQYLETLEKELPLVEGGKPLNERVTGIMERYARAAESVSLFRLAQTWRILSYAVGLLLQRRAKYHLERRLETLKSLKSPSVKDKSGSKPDRPKPEISVQNQNGDEIGPTQQPELTTEQHLRPSDRLSLGDEPESESNVPTPLARPVKDDVFDEHMRPSHSQLTPVREVGSFTLPPSLHPEPLDIRQRHDSIPLSVKSQDSHYSSTEGYDFYDLDNIEKSIPKPIDVPKRKEPLSLGFNATTAAAPERVAPPRFNSDESFAHAQMFSVSASSHGTPNAHGSLRDPERTQSEPSGKVIEVVENHEDDYQSRIRGKEIQGQQEEARPKANREDSGSLREIFMISQTTEDTADSADSRIESQTPSQQPTDVALEQTLQSLPTKSSAKERLTIEQADEETSTTIVEKDFMPRPDDPPFPFPLASDANKEAVPSPLDPYSLVCRALDFETKRSPLHASAMILLLQPLLPEGIIDPYLATALLRQYHNRLMGQQLFIEAAVLRNVCVRDWPGGVESWGNNYPSIFSPAQQRASTAFICPQCHKPRDVDHSDPDGPGVWVCERCRYLMAPCAICGHRSVTPASLPPTPIAEGLKTALLANEPILSTWWYCPGCAHGGHATCIQGWHAPSLPSKSSTSSQSGVPVVQDGSFPEMYSDGCCPMDGCGHACLPGRWRNESSTARTEELGRAVREETRTSVSALKNNERRSSGADWSAGSSPAVMGGIRSDSLEVAQSKAVEGVREALAKAGIGSSSSTSDKEERMAGRLAGGILNVLSSSPGRISGFGQASDRESKGTDRSERERRKSVKFAGTTRDDGR